MAKTYPGCRYQTALDRLKDLIEKSEAGDMKARSDLVHANEAGWLVAACREATGMLMPLKGIKAADEARHRLANAAVLATEDLSEDRSSFFALGIPPIHVAPAEGEKND